MVHLLAESPHVVQREDVHASKVADSVFPLKPAAMVKFDWQSCVVVFMKNPIVVLQRWQTSTLVVHDSQ
jgi:hypothetical protein